MLVVYDSRNELPVRIASVVRQVRIALQRRGATENRRSYFDAYTSISIRYTLGRRRPVLRRRKTGRSLWGSHTKEISHLTYDKQI
jgi:hypothetical protein